ncbi:MAG: ribokinase [Oscillospiraceae bacterium]
MKIVNLGSLNIDRVYKVHHHLRSGETQASASMQTFVGGKGLNQSVALAAAGAEVWHAGCVGEDGAVLVDYLIQHGVDTRLVQTIPGPTGHAVIQVDENGQNCILLFGGANKSLTKEHIDTVLAACDAGDILLLQNEVGAFAYILQQAAARGLRIALNPSPIDDTLLQTPLGAVSWFIMNEIEGQALTGAGQPEAMLDRLRSQYPHSQFVLTLGRQGVVYDDGKARHRHGIYDVPVVDTTAAGDTFTGYFLAGVLRALPPDEVLRQASVASSLAITRAGAAPSIPQLAEVLAAQLTPEG